MQPIDVETVFSFRMCAEWKWNENHAGVKSSSPPATYPFEVKNLNTNKEKHFHVQFFFFFSPVKAKQCLIFATSSSPYFKLDKTFFWKNKYKKKCLQIYIVHWCGCITPSQSADLGHHTSLHKVSWQKVSRKTKQILSSRWGLVSHRVSEVKH